MFNKDSVGGTFLIAGGLCLVASLCVSLAAVALKPTQDVNKARDRKKNILLAADLYKDDASIDAVFEQRVTAKVVDLETGEYVPESKVNPQTYNQRAMAKDPTTQVAIPAGQDLAKIKVRAPMAVVYEVRGTAGDQIEQVVLPVHGKGLWSTMYGFVAVAPDGDTIKGLGFYQHAETPGLGGEVDNERWKALWPGKKIYGDNGQPKIEVIKGSVDTSKPAAVYQVDGLSGATITSRGVGLLMQYWMGEDGFKKYLTRLSKNAA